MNTESTDRHESKLRFKLVVFFGSLFFSFCFCELFLFFYAKIQPDILKPVFYALEKPHPYCAIQSFIPYSDAKKEKPSEFVVLVLGGSVAWGYGTFPDKTICVRLEKHLNEQNSFPHISRFKVVNGANIGYNTTQEKNVFYQFLFLKSDIDMIVPISGFNNLSLALDNQAFNLPLNYPGWYWITDRSLGFGLVELYHFGSFFMQIRDRAVLRKTIFKSKTLFVIVNQIVSGSMKAYFGSRTRSVMPKVLALSDSEKQNAFYEAAQFYKEDVIEMSSIAKTKKIKSLFVLQPLLGLDKKPLAKAESDVLVKDAYHLRRASHQLWIQGFHDLQQAGMELKKDGINFVDFTNVFEKTPGQTYLDIMHMNAEGQDLFAVRLKETIYNMIRQNPN